MKRKLLTVSASFLISGFSLSAANIAWVSLHPADTTPSANAASAGFTNAPDIGYTALLAANGHKVTRFVTVDSLQNYPDLITALNTNNLVIISRSVPSGHYQDQAEADAWNGITVPLISLNGYINRGSRLGFNTADTIPDINSNPVRLKVNAPGHPIFAGVSLDSANLMVNAYAGIVTYTNATTGATNLQRGISVVTSSPLSSGTVLATVGTSGDAAFGGMMVGEFPAGITSQRNDLLAAKRLVLLTGSREVNGITGDSAGVCDLSPDGQKLFLNAVSYLTTAQVPKCTIPLVGATNLLAGDAWTFNAGVVGDAPLTYQWYKDGQALPSGTSAVLSLTNLALADAGAYQLIVTNSLASATSTLARLDFAVLPTVASITNGLIAYWPLDTVLGTKTPDVVSGYDMTLTKMGATNVVAGKWGNAFQFDNASQTLLERNNNPGDALPIYQFPDFTVSLWVNGQMQTDHRIFFEGSLTNNNTMFDLGTDSGGTTGTVDIYIRNDAGVVLPGDHRHSTATAFDGYSWHNVVYVQRDVGNGNMKAQLWVDGVLDSVQITPVRPLTANVTAIGAVRRASASAWYTGLIDEVAAWNRALSPQEIGILQVTAITNPPSRLQPLAINRFKADLPAVVAGGSTVLRWDVSKDATLVTLDPVGDVTAQTSVGIGNKSVTLTQSATYVLTVKRGTDTLSATTSVAVVQGVAAGWTLLDNFDQAPSANLFANGYWNDVSGNSAQVTAVKGNPAVRTTTGNSIVYLNLRDLAVAERQARTLFFRMIPGADTAGGITNIVGLTDKSQRGYGDEFVNIGPVLYAGALTNDLIGATTNAWYLGARNGSWGGNTSPAPDYPGPALQTGVVYNVWIDITNAPLADYASDSFTVYIQQEGDSARTVLFQNYTSDRDLFYIDSVLGGILPNLDKLVLMGNNSTYSATFDDFYLSTGGYNATVPRVYGYTGVSQPGSVSVRSLGTQIEVRWTNGTLQQATSISGPWADVSGNPASPYLVTPAGSAMFYRSRQ
ncbi:MAG TPA: LamG-like jellyroll fold domain-containing protein [Bacillota bacterium]|nr:LamG-like jellyroll fold domain-containing protein [Bacillota bacterium]